jgi:hypothetical protein
MSWHFGKCLKAVSFAASVAIVGVSCLACAGSTLVDKTTNDDHLSAEQCIDNNTPASVEPFEKTLVREGIVGADLDKIPMTRGMCEEIIERTPGGSPVERAAAVGNLTQELEIIKKSMEDAADKDVNGDGRVNAEDTKIASAASCAASHAAQEAVRRAAEEGSTDGGVIGALSAVPAAYLAQQQTTSVPSEQTTSTATASASASASASANAAEAEAEAQSAGLPPREQAQTNASSAAREKGAGPEAAAGGSQCAATVAVSDRTLQLQEGYMGFKAPAKEMHWKDEDRAQLVVAQKA